MRIMNETSRRLRLSRSKYITKRILDDDYYIFIAYVTGYKNGRMDEIYECINSLTDAEKV